MNTIIFADVRGVKSTDVCAATVPPCCHVPMLSISHVPMQWAPIRITPVYNSSVSRYCVILVCVLPINLHGLFNRCPSHIQMLIKVCVCVCVVCMLCVVCVVWCVCACPFLISYKSLQNALLAVISWFSEVVRVRKWAESNMLLVR